MRHNNFGEHLCLISTLYSSWSDRARTKLGLTHFHILARKVDYNLPHLTALTFILYGPVNSPCMKFRESQPFAEIHCMYSSKRPLYNDEGCKRTLTKICLLGVSSVFFRNLLLQQIDNNPNEQYMIKYLATATDQCHITIVVSVMIVSITFTDRDHPLF